MVKKILVGIVIVAVLVIAVGLCMQFFAPDNVKPSNWIKNGKDVELTKFEVGQYIDGMQFDTSKDIDFSKFSKQLEESDDGILSLMEVSDDYTDVTWDYLVIADLQKMDGFNLDKPCYALFYDFDYLLFCERDVRTIQGLGVLKGWNTEILDKNGVLNFSKIEDPYPVVKVKSIELGELWNGVIAGTSIADVKKDEKICLHCLTENGICSYCGFVLREEAVEIVRIENMPVINLNDDLSVLDNIKVVVKTNAGVEKVINRSDIDSIDCFDTYNYGTHTLYLSFSMGGYLSYEYEVFDPNVTIE